MVAVDWRRSILLVVAIVAVGAWNWFRPVPAVAATASLHSQETVQGTAPSLPWPKTGSAAVGASGLGLIATSGNEQPVAAASVTKVMTALIILTDKPLTLDQLGPTVTITDADVQAYQADLAGKQSVVEVRAGEQLTEFQLLQGMLIPSANNFAETLARWDAGTIDTFVASMNKRAADLHMAHTTFADTSGASPSTVSTPSDLMALGMEAMKQEVFAQIVSMGETTLPVAGTVFNVDGALGQSGIIGIKTGSGLAEGANFLFAAATADGHPVTVYGCVMGQPTLAIAFAAAKDAYRLDGGKPSRAPGDRQEPGGGELRHAVGGPVRPALNCRCRPRRMARDDPSPAPGCAGHRGRQASGAGDARGQRAHGARRLLAGRRAGDRELPLPAGQAVEADPRQFLMIAGVEYRALRRYGKKPR